MQKDEVMDTSEHQKAVAQFQQFLAENAGRIDDRRKEMLALRCGVEGPSESLSDIGSKFNVKRQRVFSIIKDTIMSCERKSIERLTEAFPVLRNGRCIYQKSPARKKIEIRRKLRALIASGTYDRPIQYVRLHRSIGEPPVVDRGPGAGRLGPEATCRALWEDYGIVSFGEYRMCAMCHEVIRVSDLWILANGRLFQYCKSCNKKRMHDLYWSKKAINSNENSPN